ncbi:MAG: hypothetical protein M3155_05040, partial [Actinomycetota bacterium]|nr:hypothetical protein [Actinomycetota bacterium]
VDLISGELPFPPVDVAGRTGALLRVGVSGTALSSGRCAGPTSRDVARKLPTHIFDLRRLLRASDTADLSGRTPFAAGPFAAEVVSTLRVRLGRLHSRAQVDYPSRALPPPGPRRSRLQDAVSLTYRVERLDGTLSAAFGRVAASGCELVDACGLTGDWAYALDVRSGDVVLDGLLPGRPGRFTARSALAAVRAGRVELAGNAEFPVLAPGQTSQSISRDDGSGCRDSASADAPGVEVLTLGRNANFSLGWGQVFAGNDVLRARCPGPGQLEVLGAADAARGIVPVADLARRELTVSLTGARAFRGREYAGNRQAAMTLRLRRVRVEVGPSEAP